MTWLSVERIFLVISIIKIDLHNKMGDAWLNDLMRCYSEKVVFRKIDDEEIKKWFQEIKNDICYCPKIVVPSILF